MRKIVIAEAVVLSVFGLYLAAVMTSSFRLAPKLKVNPAPALSKISERKSSRAPAAMLNGSIISCPAAQGPAWYIAGRGGSLSICDASRPDSFPALRQ
jgi:hypothetical protein